MENRTYRYDLHVHTYEGSACARSLAADIADFYKAKGYDGIVITDHFWTGNTRVDRDLPIALMGAFLPSNKIFPKMGL